jgi:hypothetical protein
LRVYDVVDLYPVSACYGRFVSRQAARADTLYVGLGQIDLPSHRAARRVERTYYREPGLV